MTSPPRAAYAQSSDIRARSWSEYRLDMKKKAVAELEFLPFLRQVLARRYKDAALRVAKHGGDAELWFDVKSVSQAPDYRAVWGDNRSFLYEFQLAEATDRLQHFDFKLAKVGKKERGQSRAPYIDREFFYILKDRGQYAFIEPQWIAANGNIAGVPAWGSRPAYRVPRDRFLPKFKNGGKSLAKAISGVDDENYLLEFQAQFLEREGAQFSRELQQVVDEEKLLSIVPRTLNGFYRVCYLLDKIGKRPEAPGVWLVYLLSFFSGDMRPVNFARYIYALDFLYFHSADLQENETAALKPALEQAIAYIAGRANAATGTFSHDPLESAREETRQILFALNLLEDIKQDAVVNLGFDLAKAAKIFEVLPAAAKTAAFIRTALDR